MKHTVTAGIFFVLTAGAAFAQPAGAPMAPAGPTGVWRVEDGTADIRIVDCGGSYWGVTVWSKDTSGDDKDKNNPNPALRNRSLTNAAILSNFTAANDAWQGQVYNPLDGRTWDVQLSLVSNDVLKIEGCMGGFCFGIGAQEWARQPMPKGAPADKAVCAKMTK
jgi:uncharacterized protein (DUF2147 family)